MPKLELTAYQPNLSDPRVQKRISSVVAWCDLHLSTASPEAVHHNELIKTFGPSGNQLSKWLRANLLIQTGVYAPGTKSFSYLLNERGMNKLRATASKHMVNTSAASAADLYPELQTLEFKYSLKSDRYWHRLQNIKRDKKAAFWKDYLPFNYDIEAAAPSILLQLAQQYGLHDLLCDHIKAYLESRDEYRQHVADLTGCSLNDAKRIINALFNGARLARNEHCSAYQLLGCNYQAMTKLQNDFKLRRLRTQIKSMWQWIGRHYEVSNPRAKWGVYFAFERKILDVIKGELEHAGIAHFTEHDGFRAEQEVDVTAIQRVVREKTKLDIKLSKS